MNLYKLHNKLKSLISYRERNNVVPELIKNQIESGEPANAQQLKSIASDPYFAYVYANYVIKGRFPEGEPAIASDPKYALWYARNIINGRFPEGEKAIASDPHDAYWYAKYIIKGRFPEGEKAIASDPYHNNLYQKLLNK